MSAPNWLTQQYIEEALQSFHKDISLRITEIQFNAALGKGENYGGVLTRVKVQYQLYNGQEKRSKTLLVKTSYEEDEFAKEKMEPYDIFNREISIYKDVLPKLNQLLKEINDDDELFATAVHADYERQALIFEDLSERGFIMADRIERLDMDHVILILRKLAKMHATSAVLNERENGVLECYDRGFFNRYSDTYSSFFVGGLLACGRYLSQVPEYVTYGEKLLALGPKYMEIGKRCFEPTPGHVNVLAHGDIWTNNVMFKYDSKTKKPIDVILIDFQYTFWGSPNVDLHYLFNTSMQEPLRLKKQDALFQYYHSVFAHTLRKLNYHSVPIPNLHTFRLHAEEKRFYAFHSTCVIQPVMINEMTEDADFNALMSEDERGLRFKNSLYKNVKVQQNLKKLLPIFDQRGLLDVNQ